jgi:5-methylcytosine-specific restriction protein A
MTKPMRAHPWRAWYKTQRWRYRARQQLIKEPWCAYCRRLAQLADHITPHRGNADLFWDGPLQSLCWSCHSSRKQAAEARGYDAVPGVDGLPTDPRHPFLKPQGRDP